GPLIDDKAVVRVRIWLEEAKRSGAKVLTGGTFNNRLLAPTVLENVSTTASVYCKEVFAPVVVLQKFQKFEEAVAAINDSEFGLQAGVFSNDWRNILYAYKNIQAGGVVINDNPTFRNDAMPYGGIKNSGLGREGVKYAIEEMTEPKLLVFSP
ncbi:MAG: aldehyde dehydrogenase family protein, partial [Ignavibacteriales bacterium]|nr:aldehyde dehydrogenase family protein [Ignavibacteriales bacterium]